MSLAARLRALDGRGYPGYKSLTSQRFEVDGLGLRVLHVQGDPFAAPSRLELLIPAARCPLDFVDLADADSRRAGADCVHRALTRALAEVEAPEAPPPPRGHGRGRGAGGGRAQGSGHSGRLAIAPLSPQVLDRSAVQITPDGGLRVVLWVGLPAAGRRILGHAAAELLCERLPAAVRAAVDGLDPATLEAHVAAVEAQVDLRGALAQAGLVAFLADGAILPRASGIATGPLLGAVPLRAPDALAVTLHAEHLGAVRGLGIPEGVTVIVGGGYHGKSTLLSAIAAGVYDHVPGDGREACVTRADAISLRAEDGRAVRGVDLRAFINDLPGDRSTARFVTADASGSTSQAAATLEALEAGARVLLIDEDTAATNFMIRDARMRALVPPAAEPITPFIDRVRQLYTEFGVSTVLVVGGAGDYLDVADTVIQLQAFEPHDVTEAARAVAAAHPLGPAAPQPPGPWPAGPPRCIDPACLALPPGRDGKVKADGVRGLRYGAHTLDLSAVAGLVEPGQLWAIGDLLRALGERRGPHTLPDLLAAAEALLADGPAGLAPGFGDRARPTPLTLACALSRFRGLRGAAPPG